MKVIKRVGKEFHVYDGTEVILKTRNFDEAVALMPEDNNVYHSSINDDLNNWVTFSNNNFKVDPYFEKISAIKPAYEFRKQIGKGWK